MSEDRMRGASSDDCFVRRTMTAGGLGFIMLDRPASLNALDVSMVEDIHKILVEWKTPGRGHPDYRCDAIPTGKSLKIVPKGVVVMSQDAYDRYVVGHPSVPLRKPCFCAGGDVKQVVERGIHMDDVEWGLAYFHREYILDFLIYQYPLPYIALMDGITFGGGVGLSIHGRYQVATENTVFSMPECAIGLFPDVGGSYFLSRMEGGLGMYLGLTGARLYGADVARTGLATHYIHSSFLPVFFRDLKERFSRCTNTSQRDDSDHIVLELLNEYDKRTREQFPPMKTSDVFTYKHQIDDIFGWNATRADDTVERIISLCIKQSKKCRFFQSIVDALLSSSPLSLKLTFQQLRRGRTMPLAECFKIDNRIIRRLTKDTSSDFYIGVSNKLIEKSSKPPRWNLTSLDEVDDALVQGYVAPLPRAAEELQLQTWTRATKL